MNCIKLKIIWIFLIGIIVQSCVPAKEFQALQDKNIKCEEERERYFNENETLEKSNKELDSKLRVLKGEVAQLIADSTSRAIELSRLKDENAKLSKRYAELQNIQETSMAGTQKESRRVLAQLQATQEELQEKQDALKELERQLNLRRKNLEELQSHLNGLKSDLDERNAKIQEMERILARKDSAVMALRRKVSDALFGFEGKGLSVQHKNGKVYVSLDEQLMFKSGSHVVDANGIKALRQLIPVLEQNQDINIVVEGHTDDVPFPQRGELTDNWDLSVKRATSIVRILLDKSKIEPARISASGRSQYHPIDPQKTSAARQKNRRTEIILTPKLDELFEILEAN
ncbi:MAG: OmpA family protein [Bacteroidales bacterium]|nr:OmpA family protein [Bacteroidales bacterium]MDY0198473.1 OmpA family protein [Tenuifilaceae bacterium]